MQKIVLSSTPNQTIEAILSVNGVNRNFQFFIRFNDIANYWVMRITDLDTNEVLLDSVPLLPAIDSSGNILAQYDYLRIGSAYLVAVSDEFMTPGIDDLGTNFILLWGDNG